MTLYAYQLPLITHVDETTGDTYYFEALFEGNLKKQADIIKSAGVSFDNYHVAVNETHQSIMLRWTNLIVLWISVILNGYYAIAADSIFWSILHLVIVAFIAYVLGMIFEIGYASKKVELSLERNKYD